MNREELTKPFMMISNWKKKLSYPPANTRTWPNVVSILAHRIGTSLRVCLGMLHWKKYHRFQGYIRRDLIQIDRGVVYITRSKFRHLTLRLRHGKLYNLRAINHNITKPTPSCPRQCSFCGVPSIYYRSKSLHGNEAFQILSFTRYQRSNMLHPVTST